MFKGIKLKRCILILLGSAILAFGLYHIHSFANVTEGGIFGVTLLLQYLFDISPSVSSLILNIVSFGFGYKVLGKNFLIYSAFSVIGFSVAYAIIEQFPPLWPQLVNMPLLAAVLGALFVGAGAGTCVLCGGATGGDDAIAMSLYHKFGIRLEIVYLVSDLLILALSICYIPISKLIYSVITVVLSGQIVGLMQRIYTAMF